MCKFLLFSLSSLGVISTATLAEPAAAQSDSTGIGDIIVTAQRREERLQDIPVSVTALDGDDLKSAGITSTFDLGVVTPGLVMGNTSGFLRPHIRGVGTTSVGAGLENSVASYIDGVYIASQPGALMSLSDVERVEVLKGPQGTLFGRNATGGVIQIITRQPSTTPKVEASLGYANYQTVRGDLYLSGPLSENLSASLTIGAEHQGEGWGTNLTTNRDVHRAKVDFATRAKLHWDGGSTRATLSGDYSYLDSTQIIPTAPIGEQRLLAPPFMGKRFDLEANFTPYRYIKAGGAMLNLQQDIGSLTLTNIVGYRKMTFDQGLDGDFSGINSVSFEYLQKDEQISAEIQLASSSSGSLNWVVGGFYMHHKAEYDPYELTTTASIRRTFSYQSTKSLSAFGQATYEFGPETHVTAGIRITDETRTVDGRGDLLSPTRVYLGQLYTPARVSQQKKFSPLTWRVAIDHRFSPEVMMFASYSRGFKSGGFNAQTPNIPGYNPETLDAYEVGAKTDLLNGRLRFNMSAFYYDYSDMQVSTYVGVVSQIYNGARAEIYGVDADLLINPAKNLTLSAGVELLHNRFKSFERAVISTPLPSGGYLLAPGSAEGNRLPFAADATFHAGFEYTVPMGDDKLSLSANYMHNTGYYTEPDNRLEQGSYDVLNAGVRYEADGGAWFVRVWGKNLTNSANYLQFATNATTEFVTYAAPRTYGITLGGKF